MQEAAVAAAARVLVGRVVGTGMDKTIKVQVLRNFYHPKKEIVIIHSA